MKLPRLSLAIFVVVLGIPHLVPFHFLACPLYTLAFLYLVISSLIPSPPVPQICPQFSKLIRAWSRVEWWSQTAVIFIFKLAVVSHMKRLYFGQVRSKVYIKYYSGVGLSLQCE